MQSAVCKMQCAACSGGDHGIPLTFLEVKSRHVRLGGQDHPGCDVGDSENTQMLHSRPSTQAAILDTVAVVKRPNRGRSGPSLSSFCSCSSVLLHYLGHGHPEVFLSHIHPPLPRVQGTLDRVQGKGCRVQGKGYRVQGTEQRSLFSLGEIVSTPTY